MKEAVTYFKALSRHSGWRS